MARKIPKELPEEIYRLGRLVQGQLEDALRAVSGADPELAQRVVEKDDLVDHFYMAGEEKIFHHMGLGQWPASEWRWLRAAMRVVINLEHVGDAASKIAARARKLTFKPPREPKLDPLAEAAVHCLDAGLEAFLQKDLGRAEEVFLREEEADHFLEWLIPQLTGGIQQHPQRGAQFLDLLFVAENLEKITDYALNMSEWVVYWVLGQRMKFANYAELKKLLSGAVPTDFHRFWDGVSGATVGGIELPEGTRLLYKSGSPRKVAQEVEKARQWARYGTGLTPRVLAVLEGKDRQAFLRELGRGRLLQDYYEQVALEEKLRVTRELYRVLCEIWRNSRRPEKVVPGFVRQIEERLGEVYRLHPHLEELSAAPLAVDGLLLPPLAVCLEEVRLREPELAVPFAVWIHGDFNSNNVLYSPETGFQFIDVARSGPGDYVQDVSVFLVSNRRRPVAAEQAQEMTAVNRCFADLVRQFAAEQQDETFELRLTLGLARSFLTSSRLWPDPAWAENLFRQGWRLLEQVRRELSAGGRP
ncbi:MAG: PhoU domain-containing protein [Clostridia bacterium]|jgi:phosphate uptake regulator|nr:phosphotransferase [Clostridia bacterium]MDH7573438.1 PhoU domain-containing protein [Clostridia bacterium]